MSLLRLFAILALITIAFSCNKKKEPANPAEQYLTTGTWRIAQAVISGENVTADFQGYVFTFSSNSKVTASNGNSSVSGQWAAGYDPGSGGPGTGSNFLRLIFTSPDEFVQISREWNLNTVTPQQIAVSDPAGLVSFVPN